VELDDRGFKRYWDEERETLEPRLRERVIVERIRHQLDYVYNELPFYRRHYDAHGFKPDQVRSLADFTAKVPVITKKMLVADQAENPLFGTYAGDFEEAEIARIQGSSGTSGTPTLYRVSRRDWERSAELAALAIWATGVRPDDLAQISFPFALFFGGWGVLQGLERLGATCFPLGATSSAQHLEMMQRLEPTLFVGTPSYCRHVATVAVEQGIDLVSGSVERLLVGGEPGGSMAGTKEALAAEWDAEAFDSGSTSEMYPFNTNVESETHEGVLTLIDEVFTEIVDKDDANTAVPYGTRGAIVYTHLWRESQPMIRFYPGDESWMVYDGPTRCGRTYPRLPEGVVGRLDDMLIVRGANIYPSAIETVLRRFDTLGAEFTIEVDRVGALDELTVRAEATDAVARESAALGEDGGRELKARIEAEIGGELSKKLQIRIPVELLEPGTLPVTTFKAKRVVDRRAEAGAAL
jgi:phenylacetate-CoA ligase